MRTGVTLATLREELMLEVGYSTDAHHAALHKGTLDQILRRTERMLAREYDWQAIKFEESVIVAADSSTAALPSNINFTDIDSVSVIYAGAYLPVVHGIGPDARSVYGATDRVLPIKRYEVIAPGTTTFEVWPIGSTAQTLVFSGTRKLGAFVADDDTCTLDADVLVLHAAAEILARDKKSDAEFKLASARRYANTVTKAQGATKAEPVHLGQRPVASPRPYVDFIPPGTP